MRRVSVSSSRALSTYDLDLNEVYVDNPGASAWGIDRAVQKAVVFDLSEGFELRIPTTSANLPPVASFLPAPMRLHFSTA